MTLSDKLFFAGWIIAMVSGVFVWWRSRKGRDPLGAQIIMGIGVILMIFNFF